MLPFHELPERIRDKIDPNGKDGCWNWFGVILRNGYGQASLRGKKWLAHRIVYQLLVGLIPKDLTIDHLCKNRACVNPNHLEPVIISVNIMRGLGVAAINARKDRCVHGHLFNVDNVYIRSIANGRYGRGCRECYRVACRKWRNEHKIVLLNKPGDKPRGG